MPRAVRVVILLALCAPLYSQIPPLGKGIQPARSNADTDPSPASDDRVAVVVGIDHYDASSGFANLQFAQNDADAMARALTRAGYLVKRIPESEATAGAILDAIEQQGKMLTPVRGSGKQGTFLFYFSGHGTAVDRQNYLITPHSSHQRLTRDSLGIDEIEAKLAQSPARRKVLLIDACRTVPKDGTRAIADDDRFSEFRAAEGERVLLAAPFGEPSREFPELSHGVFTYFLLKAFESDPSDISGKPYVTFRDMADYVSRETRRWTNAKGLTQVPRELGEATFEFVVTGGIPTSPSSRPALAPETDVLTLSLANRGRELVLQKNYAEAIPLLRNAAASGSARAMFELGSLYAQGHGVAQSYTDAMTWYLRAAALGEPRAMSAIGGLYEFGRGVQLDYAQALKWFRDADKSGDVVGACEVGEFYSHGYSVPQDYKEAMRWFRKAADAGNALAMSNIAYLYEDGHGVPQDYKEAMTWYHKAADAGEPAAMFNIAAYYEKGDGVPKDLQQAIFWYRKAAAADDPEAPFALNRLGVGK